MRIKYCEDCDAYTLRDVCSCGKKTKNRSPARFKPDDKYEKYRRDVKWNSLSKQ